MRRSILSLGLSVLLLFGLMSFTLPVSANCDFCYSGWQYNGHFEGGECDGDRYFCYETGAVLWECDGGGMIIVDIENSCSFQSSAVSPSSLPKLQARLIMPGDEGYAKLKKALARAKARSEDNEQRCNAQCLQKFLQISMREEEIKAAVAKLRGH